MSFVMKAELLTDVDGIDRHGRVYGQALRLIHDPNFGAQEKFNGERRIVCKEAGKIWMFNRDGDVSKTTGAGYAACCKVLGRHPLSRFVIDAELMADGTLHIFDALVLGTELLGADEYEYREARSHAEFDNFHPSVKVAYTARTPEAIFALINKQFAEKAEGVVFKDMRKAYRQGRAGQNFRLKFLKTVDCVVMGFNREGKNSVEIGVYDERGKLHRVSGCSLNGKPLVKIGDVIEVTYLYGTRERHIVQPRMERVRNDKPAAQCTIDQLVISKNFRR